MRQTFVCLDQHLLVQFDHETAVENPLGDLEDFRPFSATLDAVVPGVKDVQQFENIGYQLETKVVYV